MSKENSFENSKDPLNLIHDLEEKLGKDKLNLRKMKDLYKKLTGQDFEENISEGLDKNKETQLRKLTEDMLSLLNQIMANKIKLMEEMKKMEKGN